MCHAPSQTTKLRSKDGEREVDFVEAVMAYRKKLSPASNMGELAAFIGYAQAFPDGFLALVDTYDTLNSGVPNFLAVALALHDLGYTVRARPRARVWPPTAVDDRRGDDAADVCACGTHWTLTHAASRHSLGLW